MGVEGRSCRRTGTRLVHRDAAFASEAPARRKLTWVLPASPAGRSLCSLRFEASRGEAGSGSGMAFLSLASPRGDAFAEERPSSRPKKRADPRPRRSGSTPAEELLMRTIRLL